MPPTAWIGTTVDEQYRVKIAEEAFRKIKDVRVKWLSLEPLLEPLKFNDLSMFDWVVIGAQSATKQPDGKGGTVHVPEISPPFEWVMDIVVQARKAGCRIYMKENLLGRVDSQSPGMKLIQEWPAIFDQIAPPPDPGEIRFPCAANQNPAPAAHREQADNPWATKQNKQGTNK